MASVEEITAQLERQLDDATRKIEDFVKQQSDLLAKAAKDHEETIRALEGKIQRLSHEEASAFAQHDALQRELEAEKARLSATQSELTRLDAASKSMPVEVDAMRAAEAAARAKLEQEKAEAKKRELDVKYQLNELTKGVDLFGKRLGLEFEKIDAEKLRLSFTLIDPRQPKKQFAFNVRIADGDAYEVDNVSPAVSGVDELVRQLNIDNDFSKFVQLMRRKFVASASGHV